MTVKQLQELYYISQNEPDALDRSIKLVACYTGVTPDKVDAMPVRRFTRICQRIGLTFELLGRQQFKGKPRRYVLANGRLYRLHYDIARFHTAGRYVEAVTFQKDIITNLHKLLATMAEPVRWYGKPYKREHADIAADMEQVDIGVAYHAAVFFYQLYAVSMQAIQPYLIQEAVRKGMKREAVEASLQGLWSILDGLPMPKWCRSSREYLSHRFGI